MRSATSARRSGFPYAELERLARLSDGWDARRVGEELEKLPDGERKLGSKRWRAFAWLAGEIAGLPRHVSQHPGGMIVSTRPLIELVPVQPAAMAGRQLCQWDKDSCADAGFLKIDLLGLGMLSAVEDCVEQIARTHDEVIDLSRIPFDDEEVFADIQRADTVGAFQIESRAQMQSLLRTKPENLDDLTVQVALVRPGPIQGKAVHPYIDARERLRGDPSYVWPVDHELLREPLRSTFGVVVFQDQVLEVAIALAGFTVGEAEGLRRAMSRKRSHDALEAYRGQFVAGAAAKGVDAETRGRASSTSSSASRASASRRRMRPRSACSLPVAVAAAALRRRVPVRAAERPADGLLPACDPGSRRATAWGGGAAGRRQPERRAVHDRACRLEAKRLRRSSGSGSHTSPRSGTTTRQPSSPSATRTGRFATSATLPAERRSPATGSRRSSRAAPATASAGDAAISCWELGLVLEAAVGAGNEGGGEAAPALARPDRRDTRSSAT